MPSTPASSSGPPIARPYAAIDVPGRPSTIDLRRNSSDALSRNVGLTSDGAWSAAPPLASLAWHGAHSATYASCGDSFETSASAGTGGAGRGAATIGVGAGLCLGGVGVAEPELQATATSKVGTANRCTPSLYHHSSGRITV